eukprot:COSAG01_NODE_3400_length_6142_cov_8.459374_2_plen_183_part_00
MQRRYTINRQRVRKVFLSFVLPFSVLHVVLKSFRYVCGALRKVPEQRQQKFREISGVEIVLTHIRRTTGKTPFSKYGMVLLLIVFWCTVVYACVMNYLLDTAMTSMEARWLLLYYAWAVLLLSMECACEIACLPGDESFEESYLKAELSTATIQLTRIEDGQSVLCTAMGLLQMICKQMLLP